MREGYKYDAIFDWTIIRAQESIPAQVPMLPAGAPIGEPKRVDTAEKPITTTATATAGPSLASRPVEKRPTSREEEEDGKGQSSASKLVEKKPSVSSSSRTRPTTSALPGMTTTTTTDPYGAMAVDVPRSSSFTRLASGSSSARRRTSSGEDIKMV